MDLYYPVREAYFDFFWKGFGGRNWLRIGKQQHVWGKADFFRLQDIVNPVNFGDHFFIDLFDDTRVPLWSALFEHRFGNIGPLRDVAGSVIYVFDRHTPTGLGHPAQPWATGFGRTIDGFVFGNDLFSSAVFPEHGRPLLRGNRRPTVCPVQEHGAVQEPRPALEPEERRYRYALGSHRRQPACPAHQLLCVPRSARDRMGPP